MSDPSVIKIGFGKHCGKTIDKIPTTWIEWALREARYLDDPVRQAMHAELKARGRPPEAWRWRKPSRYELQAEQERLDLLSSLRQWRDRMQLEFDPAVNLTATPDEIIGRACDLIARLWNLNESRIPMEAREPPPAAEGCS